MLNHNPTGCGCSNYDNGMYGGRARDLSVVACLLLLMSRGKGRGRSWIVDDMQ